MNDLIAEYWVWMDQGSKAVMSLTSDEAERMRQLGYTVILYDPQVMP